MWSRKFLSVPEIVILSCLFIFFLNHKIKYTRIRQYEKEHIGNWTRQSEGAGLREKHKRQKKLTHSQTRELREDTKPEAVIAMWRTWSRPVQGLWVHVSIDHVGEEDLVFLVSSILSGSYHISASCSGGFPELWGEGFGGDIPLRTECFRVRTGWCSMCTYSEGSFTLFPTPHQTLNHFWFSLHPPPHLVQCLAY